MRASTAWVMSLLALAALPALPGAERDAHRRNKRHKQAAVLASGEKLAGGKSVATNDGSCSQAVVRDIKYLKFDANKAQAVEANCGVGYFRIGPNIGSMDMMRYLCVSYREENAPEGTHVVDLHVAPQDEEGQTSCPGGTSPVTRLKLGDAQSAGFSQSSDLSKADYMPLDVNPTIWWHSMGAAESAWYDLFLPWKWPFGVPRVWPFTKVGSRRKAQLCLSRASGNASTGLHGISKIRVLKGCTSSDSTPQLHKDNDRTSDISKDLRSPGSWDLTDTWTMLATNWRICFQRTSPCSDGDAASK